MEDFKYKVVRNKYLADGLAFIGFRYKKYGFGEETEYRFENSEELMDTIGKLLDIKKQLGN